MDGRRHSVTAPDGVSIGLLTAGTGPALLLVHGGMGRIERWAPMWEPLTERWRVTAMDRRGRGSTGDAEPYAISKEYDDIAAVAASLAAEEGGPVDVFAHSYGATCTLGAAARGRRSGGSRCTSRPGRRPPPWTGSSGPMPWSPRAGSAARWSASSARSSA